MAGYVTNFIYSITPTQNQIDVALNSTVSILFNENMDPESLSAETIRFKKGSVVVPADFVLGKLNKELSIIPHSLLESNQTYKIEVLSKDSGPRTVFGNLSSKEYLFYFTTVDATPSLSEDETIIPEAPEAPEETEYPSLDLENPLGDPLFSSLELLDSYPKEGDLVSSLESIVLSFDQKVNANEAADFIYLREKAISSLLSKLNKTTRILCLPSPDSSSETLVLVLASQPKEGTAYELVLEKNLSAADNPEIKLSNEKVVSFQMQWELFYTTVESVKLLLGVFKDMYTDAEIAIMIHQESLATYQMMSMKDNFDPLLWDKKAPYAATQYVLYRTAYQAMLGQVIETASGMKQSIKLGDLSVGESSSVSSQITDLMGLFQAEMDKWWKLLNGLEEDVDGTYRPKLSKTTGSATRGSTDYPYPDWMKRVPYKDLGG